MLHKHPEQPPSPHGDRALSIPRLKILRLNLTVCLQTGAFSPSNRVDSGS